MRKMLVIAVREYQAAVRTKMFLVSLVMMPMFIGGSILASTMLEDQKNVSEKKIAVVDRSGIVYEPLLAAAKFRNENTIIDPETKKPVDSPFKFVKIPAEGDVDQQRLALSDQVKKGDYFAFCDIPADISNPDVQQPVNYYSNNPAYMDARHFLQGTVSDMIRNVRLNEMGLDPLAVARATSPVMVESRSLVTQDAKTGEIKEGEKVNEIATFFIPMIMMMLMFMVITIGATPLMQGVLEEKMQRIAEVLLGSVTPFQLMAGKLIGMVGVSLTIMILYSVGGVIIAGQWGYSDVVPTRLIVWFVVYQVMAIFMFGSLFAAVGAACSDLKEAQSAFMPVWLVVCIPLFVWFHAVREPMSTFSTVLSLFPPATPMLMLVRQVAAPALPIWQPLLGLVLTAAATVLCVFAAGRVFRVGLLMQGKSVNLRQMLKWAIKG